MFRTVPLSIIRSSSLYTQQTCMTYTIAVYSVKLLMMDRGTVRNMQFYSKNKFEKLVHLVGFIISTKSSIKMQNQMNENWQVAMQQAVGLIVTGRRKK